MDPVTEPVVPAEPTTPATPEPDPATPPEGDAPKDEKDPRVEKANAEAAKYRKELREAQAALKARDDADKTDAEKEAESKAETAKEIATLRRERAALKAGLPEELAERLVGDTPDELAEDAKRLKALFAPVGASADPSPGDEQPWAGASQGTRGNPTPASLPQKIADAEGKGDYVLARQLKAQMVGQQKPVGT